MMTKIKNIAESVDSYGYVRITVSYRIETDVDDVDAASALIRAEWLQVSVKHLHSGAPDIFATSPANVDIATFGRTHGFTGLASIAGIFATRADADEFIRSLKEER